MSMTTLSALPMREDVIGLSATGLVCTSATKNEEIPSLEIRGQNGFTDTLVTYGSIINYSSEYHVTKDTSISSIQLGKTNVYDGRTYMLGSFSVATALDQAPTITVGIQQIEDNGEQKCTCTLDDLNINHWMHPQNFGLFTNSDCLLQSSTLNINTKNNIDTVDGKVIASDLGGGSVTIDITVACKPYKDTDGTIKYKNPVITPSSSGVGNVGPGLITSKSWTDTNGSAKTHTCTITYPLQADAELG